MESQTFAAQGDLITLRLSGNPIAYLYANCLSGLSNLQSLYLDRISGRTAVYSDTLSRLPSLDNIYMSASPSLAGKVVRGLTGGGRTATALSSGRTAALRLPARRLDTLDLADCGAATVSGVFADYVDRNPPYVLRLTSVVWRCDRRMQPFAEWLRNTQTTVNPPRVGQAIVVGRDAHEGRWRCGIGAG